MEFFFSMHGSSEDIAGFKERIAQADVVVVESYGWTQEYLADL